MCCLVNVILERDFVPTTQSFISPCNFDAYPHSEDIDIWVVYVEMHDIKNDLTKRLLELIRLETRLHKQKHIHNGIWTMLGVRWSHAFLALPLLLSFFSLNHTDNMG